MIKIIFIYILLLFPISSVLASELKCMKQAVIKVPNGPKTERKEKSNLCYSEKDETFISANCKNKQCLAYSLNKIVFVEWSEIGTPGSRLCYKLGGQAQIINLTLNKKVIKTDRCYFEKDQSFVDIGTLVKYNRELEEKIKVAL